MSAFPPRIGRTSEGARRVPTTSPFPWSSVSPWVGRLLLWCLALVPVLLPTIQAHLVHPPVVGQLALQEGPASLLVDPSTIADDVPTSSSSGSNHNNITTSTTTLHDLPDAFFRQLWQEHGYREARKLRQLSRTVRDSVDRSSSETHRYRAMFPLTSVLACLAPINHTCLSYWAPELHRFSQLHLLKLYIALNVALRRQPRDERLQAFGFEVASLCDDRVALYAEEYFLYIFQSLIHGIVIQFRGAPAASAPSLARMLREAYAGVVLLLDRRAGILEQVLHQVAPEGLSPTQGTYFANLVGRGQQFTALFADIGTGDLPLAALLRQGRIMSSALQDIIHVRDAQFQGYVDYVVAHAPRLPSLEEAEVHAPLSIFPPDVIGPAPAGFALTLLVHRPSHFVVRLVQGLVVARRLDLLRVLVRERGLPLAGLAGIPHHPSGDGADSLPKGGCNLLQFVLDDLRREAVSSSSLHHHEGATTRAHPSWAPPMGNVEAVRLLLENGGGGRLLYPRLMLDAEELGDPELLVYLRVERGLALEPALP